MDDLCIEVNQNKEITIYYDLERYLCILVLPIWVITGVISELVADTHLSRNHYNPEKKFGSSSQINLLSLLYQLFDKMSHQQEDVRRYSRRIYQC